MSDQPDGRALLEVARRTLLDRLLPLLPDESTYDALMIANAMSIAAREMASGQFDEASLIAQFYSAAACGEQQPATLQALAGLIRARKVPAAAQQALRTLLLDLTRQRLQQSNPKYLKR